MEIMTEAAGDTRMVSITLFPIYVLLSRLSCLITRRPPASISRWLPSDSFSFLPHPWTASPADRRNRCQLSLPRITSRFQAMTAITAIWVP